MCGGEQGIFHEEKPDFQAYLKNDQKLNIFFPIESKEQQ